MTIIELKAQLPKYYTFKNIKAKQVYIISKTVKGGTQKQVFNISKKHTGRISITNSSLSSPKLFKTVMKFVNTPIKYRSSPKSQLEYRLNKQGKEIKRLEKIVKSLTNKDKESPIAPLLAPKN